MASVKRIVDFMRIVGRLKHTARTGWVKRDVPDPESVADHMYRMAVMSFLLEPSTGLDRTKCIKMSLVHDLAEAVVGDITPHCGVSKEEKSKKEEAAILEIISLVGSAVGQEILELWKEYEHQTTKESIFVKDLDKFDMILEAYDNEVKSDRVGDSWLQEFFDSTKGKIQTKQVQDWVTELHHLRDSAGSSDTTDETATQSPNCR